MSRLFARTFLLSSALPAAVLLILLAWVAAKINWTFVASLDFGVLYTYRYPLAVGLLNTVAITGLSLALGLALGVSFACLLYVPFAPLRWLIITYVEILRDIPLVVALFWIHFALPLVTGISTTVFESGFIAMALQSSAYLADVARAGIQAVPKGQWEAAEAIGLSRARVWTDVVLPQALRLMIPPLANVGIGYFKASSALALLSVGELMTVAARISSYSFKPIETLTITGIIYLVLGYILSALTFQVERRLQRGKR